MAAYKVSGLVESKGLQYVIILIMGTPPNLPQFGGWYAEKHGSGYHSGTMALAGGLSSMFWGIPIEKGYIGAYFKRLKGGYIGDYIGQYYRGHLGGC